MTLCRWAYAQLLHHGYAVFNWRYQAALQYSWTNLYFHQQFKSSHFPHPLHRLILTTANLIEGKWSHCCFNGTLSIFVPCMKFPLSKRHTCINIFPALSFSVLFTFLTIKCSNKKLLKNALSSPSANPSQGP